MIDVFDPQPQDNLTRLPRKKQRMSKNTGVKRLIEELVFVSSNAHTSSQRASLFIVEDNDTVIKMTKNVRSPTKRHVSRTHRVDVDWLFGRINLDPWIQINFADINRQDADVLTKGSLARERWFQLTHLFNLGTPHLLTSNHFSFKKFLTVQKDDRMSKRDAELITEGHTGKPGPVPNLSAYVKIGEGQQGRLCCWRGATTSDNKGSQQALRRAWKSQPL